MPLTFEEWLKTKRYVDDLGKEYSDESIAGYNGYVYQPGYIRIAQYGEGNKYHLHIERSEWDSPTIEPLEKILWNEWAKYEADGGGETEYPNSYELHKCAQHLMDAFAKPGWKQLSLDEWLAEYHEELPEEVRTAGHSLYKLFFLRKD